MNGYEKNYGTLSIPESKKEDFLHDVNLISDQAGLFAIRHMRVYDQEFDLLCFPEDQEEDVCFDYSYFENLLHEKDTIDAETRRIQSNNITSGPFGAAVQTLSMLAELYSNSFFCNDNRVGSKEMRWLCYVLDRPLTLPCHTTVWDVYEQYMQHIENNAKISAMEFFDSYVGDATDFDEIITISYVNNFINEDYVKECVKQKEPVDKLSYGYWVRAMARFLWLAKRDSMKSEKELLGHYSKFLHNVSKIREEIAAGVDVSPVKELFATVAPPITVKLISIT